MAIALIDQGGEKGMMQKLLAAAGLSPSAVRTGFDAFARKQLSVTGAARALRSAQRGLLARADAGVGARAAVSADGRVHVGGARCSRCSTTSGGRDVLMQADPSLSAATLRSAIDQVRQEQPDPDRASRASARPPSPRGASRSASRRSGDVPESLLGDVQAARARHGRADRGRQVPRRVRGAAQGGARTRCRRRWGEVVLFIDEIHTVVGAGPPRARWTRATCSSRRSRAASCAASARRRSTSTASTSRRTPRSSAASSRCRRPAECGGDDRHPARPQGALRAAPRRAHLRRRAGGGGDALRSVHRRPLPARQGDRPGRRGGAPSVRIDATSRPQVLDVVTAGCCRSRWRRSRSSRTR